MAANTNIALIKQLKATVKAHRGKIAKILDEIDVDPSAENFRKLLAAMEESDRLFNLYLQQQDILEKSGDNCMNCLSENVDPLPASSTNKWKCRDCGYQWGLRHKDQSSN